jgi:hypothetical protein
MLKHTLVLNDARATLAPVLAIAKCQLSLQFTPQNEHLKYKSLILLARYKSCV